MSVQSGSRGTRGHSGSREERPADEAWLARQHEFTRARDGVANRPLSGLQRSGYDNHESAAHEPRPSQPRQHRTGDPDHFDREYLQWRDEQLRMLDADYEAWRRERYARFTQEFGQWRSARVDPGGAR